MMRVGLWASVLSLVIAASGCNDAKTILLNVTSDEPVERYDIYLRDNETAKVFYHSGYQPTDKKDKGPIDTRMTPFSVGLVLSRGGKFTLLMVGVAGNLEGDKPALDATQFFYAKRFDVSGPVSTSARLLVVPFGDDADRDLWPDATTWLSNSAEASSIYGTHPELLDCNDKTDNPTADVMLPASRIHPFALEVCGDGYDENCSGANPDDERCIDADGDGDVFGSDCDDKDETRHHATAADPFPDPPNCCGYNLGKMGTSEEHVDFMGDPVLCPTKRCDDGIDQSCKERDTTCIVDADCDGFPAPPIGNDCNDSNAAIHPGAPEPCGSTEDMNCSGAIGEGCVPCDLDGDGFQRNDVPNGCPRDPNQNPGQFDCNDNDAGVFPGATAACGGTEAGGTPLQRRNCAIRGACRHVYGNAATGVARVASFGEQPGDMDCNGVAYEGCPSVTNDVDGDGFASMGSGGNDCDDNDPLRFPGAPDKCGDGIAQNCTADSACDADADGDTYNNNVDCDDMNPNVRPWAMEQCNGRDDDCDGLVDEGNPDLTGAPLVSAGAVTQCTDSSVGECDKKKGRCVCSNAFEMASYNQTNRVACPGENNAQGAQQNPKCFGAGQPAPQTCDANNPKDDDCDGRNDDPAGANLLSFGMQCGVTVGTCMAGTIIGCDSTTANPFYGPGNANRWLVCSPGTIFPMSEICDGRDNNCDNVVPPNEDDQDNDGYMACSGCVGPYPVPIMGCSDCDDSLATGATRTPGADEDCDGIDNDCDNGTGDGSDSCGQSGMPPNCCPPMCVNTQTDPQHCGNCTNACATSGNSPKANGCAGGMCRCDGAAACTGANWCNTGSGCQPCDSDQHCGPMCTNCLVVSSVCNAAHTGCIGCNNDADCNIQHPGDTHYCNSSNVCTPKRANGATCTTAMCAGGSCTQCVSGNCVNGRCCEVSQAMCNGCRACNVPNGGGTQDGMCRNVPNGNDTNDFCPDMPAACQQADCNGNNSCAVANNTACGTNSCMSSMATTNSCQAGVCTPNTVACANPTPVCNAGMTACAACTDSAQCGAGKFCRADGTCQNDLPQGDACGTVTCLGGGCSPCASNFCVDGFCCNTACTGDCDRCDAASSTGPDGTCSPAEAGEAGAPSSCGIYLCDGTTTSCPTTCSVAGGANQCTGGNCCNGAACGTNNSNEFCGASCENCLNNTTDGHQCISGDCGCDGDEDCTGIGGQTCNMGSNTCM